ncbi:hypothetical protein GP486_006094, partial [Trichoglossum hirsutum]
MRRLLIVAAADGLVLQPLGQRNLPNPPAVEIAYKTANISPLKVYNFDSAASSLEAHGVVGLLNVPSTSFLIIIAGRQQVAQLRGKSVFVITDVALIPLASRTEASAAIAETRDSSQKQRRNTDELGADIEQSDPSGEDISSTENGEFSNDELSVPTPPELLPGNTNPRPHRRTSIVEDVIGKKGRYGRFAEKWFSKSGWNVEKMRRQGMSTEDSGKEEELSVFKGNTAVSKHTGTERQDGIDEITQSLGDEGQSKGQAAPDAANIGKFADSATSALLPKLLRTTKLLLGSSRGFFYSYDYDITRNLQRHDPNVSGLPLHRVVDPSYFWNRRLVLPFIEAGQHALVLPIMQGFVGQRSFIVSPSTSITSAEAEDPAPDEVDASTYGGLLQGETRGTDDTELLLTLISRRSVKRAGLRYLRRGVDDDGNAANSVETEQILSHPSWPPSRKVYSFVQMRGSIPLYFTQSPYSFKPIPMMQHSPSINQAAFKKHFTGLVDRYGNVQAVSLVEKRGNEAQIGMEYEKSTNTLNRDGGVAGVKVKFEWFDFHAGDMPLHPPISPFTLPANCAVVCRGMKFERVGLLVDSLGHTLDEFGCTISLGEKVQVRQKGVLRTNCMDCLDRTNVAQSACGRRALESQLKAENFVLDANNTQWFDMLWADNGDAISKQYSSTAALKGDFTRTRKRDYRGALNDFGLTLSRYFNNIIGDYFTQAAIDYLLGNVTPQVFEEFEADMMTADPAISMRRIRQDAIETSSNIVIADESEELIDGWAMLAPKEQNST